MTTSEQETSQTQHMTHEHSHGSLRNSEWASHEAARRGWLGIFEESDDVVADLVLTPALSEAMSVALRITGATLFVGCMDEGVCAHEGLSRRAGSGVLLSIDERKSYARYLVNRVKALALQTGKPAKIIISSHDGCGAAGIAKAQNNDQRSQLVLAEEEAQAFVMVVQEVNDELGGEVQIQQQHQHITAAEMTRPEIHNAVGAVIDFTGSFNNAYPTTGDSLVKAMPPMFNVNAEWSTMEQGDNKTNWAIAETLVAINIAFGDHGFGDSTSYFSEENPFIITLVYGKNSQGELVSKEQVMQLKSDLVSAVNADEKKAALLKLGRIKISILDVAGLQG